MAEFSVPEARAVRANWWQAPPAMRAELESLAGSRVEAAFTQAGGFSEGVAARLRLVDGSRLFVKGMPVEGRASTFRLYTREADIVSVLPADLPAPRFIGRLDVAGWVLLAFTDIAGHAVRVPWSAADLAEVAATLARMSERSATAGADIGLEPWGGTEGEWSGWRDAFTNQSEHELSPWAIRHSGQLLALESRCAEATQGAALLHSDLRSDNIIVTESGGGATFVDWAWASRGASWIDPLIFALTGAVQGMPDPEAVFRAQPCSATAEPNAVDATLAALAGRFIRAARWSKDEGLDDLHRFQVAEAQTAMHWLSRRTGWT